MFFCHLLGGFKLSSLYIADVSTCFTIENVSITLWEVPGFLGQTQIQGVMFYILDWSC